MSLHTVINSDKSYDFNPLNTDSGFYYALNSFIQSNSKKIGEILIQENLLDDEKLKIVLAEQKKNKDKGINISFGDIMLKKNYVSDRITLLKVLKKHGFKLKLGETLLLKGYITEEQLSDAIITQSILKSKNRNISIGNILVTKKIISKEKLESFIETGENKVSLKDHILYNNIVSVQDFDEIVSLITNLNDNELLNLLFHNKKITVEQLYDLVDEFGVQVNL